MIIRPATLADVPALATMGRETFIAKFGHLYARSDLDRFLAENHSEPVVAEQVADDGMVCLLAVDGETLAGFCKTRLESTFAEHARGKRPMELKQLYTDPSRIGGGIGSRLLAEAMRIMAESGADEIQLSVWSENVDAQRFYLRHGFEKVADIHFWVGDHRDDEFLFARMV